VRLCRDAADAVPAIVRSIRPRLAAGPAVQGGVDVGLLAGLAVVMNLPDLGQ
jgi:hypothetical protein